jgi:hypothetical protein
MRDKRAGANKRTFANLDTTHDYGPTSNRGPSSNQRWLEEPISIAPWRTIAVRSTWVAIVDEYYSVTYEYLVLDSHTRTDEGVT